MKAQMKAIVASAVVIVLALAAVSGVTYSWFSDTEESDITVSTAKIDINGVYDSVSVSYADGTGVGTIDDTSARISNDEKDLAVENMMANRMISAEYTLTNYSTVDTVFRLYAVVEGIGDGLASTSVSITGGTDPVINGEALAFSNGIAYIIGDENSGVVMSKPLSEYDRYDFTVKITFGNNVAQVGDFSIRMVFEAYQSDYTYTPVQVISSNGTAVLPNAPVTGDVTFKGPVPAEQGATPAEAEVVFSADALNTITNNGADVVQLSMLMLDSGSDAARINLDLNGTDVTEFGDDNYVTITVKIPGQYSDIQVYYDGIAGSQPIVLDVSYDSGSDFTSVTFMTNHFSEFIFVDGDGLSGVAVFDGTYYGTFEAVVDAYEDAGDTTRQIFIISDGKLVRASIVSDFDSLVAAAKNGGVYLVKDLVNDFGEGYEGGSGLISFNKTVDTTLIGVGSDNAVILLKNLFKSSSSQGTMVLPAGSTSTVVLENLEFDFEYTDTGAWHTRSVYAGAGTLVLNDCSFTGSNVAVALNSGGTANVFADSCMFTGDGAVNTAIYARGSGEFEISNCVFNSYPIGINIDATETKTKMTISDNTFNMSVPTEHHKENMTADHNGAAIGIAWNVRTATYDGMHFIVCGNKFIDSTDENVDATVLSMGSGSYADAKKYYTPDNANFIRELFLDNELPYDAKYSYRLMFSNSEYKFATLDEDVVLGDYVVVTKFEDLVDATKFARSITLGNDIDGSAENSNGYGSTGIYIKNQILDGNGHSLSISGANGTWDSAVAVNGGIIKNLTIDEGFRGIFVTADGSTVILENVVIDGPTYTISCDQASGFGLEATDCTFNGWTSYAATLGNVKFTDCNFGEGAGYSFCRPYAPTAFVNCNFESGFQMDARAAITFEDCYLDGVLITKENLATLVTYNSGNASVV